MEDPLEPEKNQRMEAMKLFAFRYRYTLIAAAVLLLAVIAGAWGWLEYRQGRIAEASDIYGSAVGALEEGSAEAARQDLETLIGAYGATPYGAFARVLQGRLLFSQDQPQKALSVLEPLVEGSSGIEVARHVAVAEQARIRWQASGPESGLQALKALEGEAYMPSYFQLKGDMLRALDREADARAAYDRAANASGSRFLEPGLGWRQDRVAGEEGEP